MKTIQSIDRAINVIEYIARNQNCRLIDMCNHFNLNKSTLHGILSTLEYHGLLCKDSINTTYTLGAKIFELGKLYEDNLSIKTIAKPYLINLVQRFAETVHLAVLNDLSVLYIDKQESTHPLRMTSRVGTTDPLLTTAVGKSILSTLPEDKISYILKSLEERNLVDYSIITKNDILNELSIVKDKGFALDLEELEIGLNCIAVPIKNSVGEAIAALSISAPTSRFSKDILEEMKLELKKACNSMNKSLKQLQL